MNKILGHRIKLFRTKNKIPREKLSKDLDMSIHTLSKYEQGQREPSIQTLTKISNYLKINLDSLTCSEFFGNEILNRAIKLNSTEIGPDDMDLINKIAPYANNDILYSCHYGEIDDLPPIHIKRILYYLNNKFRNEFIKIYNDLVLTNIYNLDSDIIVFCKNLYFNKEISKDFMDVEDEYSDDDPRKYQHYISEIKFSNASMSYFPDSDSFSRNSIENSYSGKDSLVNLIKYRLKDFDFSSLSNENFDNILKNTLDFIEYQIYIIQKDKNNN